MEAVINTSDIFFSHLVLNPHCNTVQKMDSSCSTNGSNEDCSYLMNKNISEDNAFVENSCSERTFDIEVRGVDFSSEIQHKPLEASQGVWIKTNESKREKELLEERIASLEKEINANAKEIASLKEILSGRDKEIADLKEKLFQLQQNGERKQFDFEKQMATVDEELRKARRNIDEAAENVVTNKAEVEGLQSELQIFNAKYYFDLQPSWFDTLPKNVGCLEAENYPVTARDLEAMKTNSSNSKLSADAAKDYAELKDRLPRTPTASAVRAEVEKNSPSVRSKDIESTTEIAACVSQRVIPFSKKAKRLDRPPHCPVTNVEGAEVEKSTPPVQLKNAASTDKITDPSVSKVNPFSKRARDVTRPSHFPVANFKKAEVEKSTPPVQLKNAASTNKITDPSVSEVNPFSKRARDVTRPSHFPVANFKKAEVEKSTPPVQLKNAASTNKITDPSVSEVNPFSKRARDVTRRSTFPMANVVEAQTVKSVPPILSKDVSFKGTDSSNEVNPFSKKAKGSAYSHHRPLPSIPLTTVLDGSPMASTYQQTNQLNHRNVKPFPHTEQGFLSKTFNKWFGSY